MTARKAVLRTSETHPLKIYETTLNPKEGSLLARNVTHEMTLGITLAPGLTALGAHGPQWKRDFHMDAAEISAWNPDMIVVINDQENAETIANLKSFFGSSLVRSLPLSEWPVSNNPDEEFLRSGMIEQILRISRRRFTSRILVISKFGTEDAASFAAEILIHMAYLPEEAIAMISSIKPDGITTNRQRDHLADLSSRYGEYYNA